MERLESFLRERDLKDFVPLGGAIAVLSDDEDNDEGIDRAAEDRLDRAILGATHYRCCKKYTERGVLVTIQYYRRIEQNES